MSSYNGFQLSRSFLTDHSSAQAHKNEKTVCKNNTILSVDEEREKKKAKLMMRREKEAGDVTLLCLPPPPPSPLLIRLQVKQPKCHDLPRLKPRPGSDPERNVGARQRAANNPLPGPPAHRAARAPSTKIKTIVNMLLRRGNKKWPGICFFDVPTGGETRSQYLTAAITFVLSLDNNACRLLSKLSRHLTEMFLHF